MFFGTYTPKLDDKGRLILPAKFRDQLAGGLMVTRGQEHCLYVWPQTEVERITERLREAPVSNKAMLVMVHQLSDAEQITVLNFSGEEVSGGVRSEQLVPGSVLVDMFTDEEVGVVDDLYSFGVRLGPHEFRSLLVLCPGEHLVSHGRGERPSVRD